MESWVNSKAKRENQGNDGRIKWRRKPRGKVKVRADCHKQKAIRQGKTADRIDWIAERIVVKIEGKDICKFL